MVLKWLVLLGAFCACALRYLNRAQRASGTLVWLSIFVSTAAACSVIGSHMLTISIAKVASFFIGAATMLLASDQCVDENKQVNEDINATLMAVMLWNFILLFFDQSYRDHDSLFRGLFFHPQVNGIVMAVGVVWFLRRIFIHKGGRILNVGLLSVASVSLFAAGSRTAALAILSGLLLTTVIALVWRTEWLSQWRQYVEGNPYHVALAGFCVFFFLTLPGVTEAMKEFIVKRGMVSEYAQPLESPRRTILTNQLGNIQERLWFGWGFGVSPNAKKSTVIIEERTGIPVSAPTEKGLLLTGLIEEVGLIGFSVFICLWFSLFIPIMNRTDVLTTWLALTAFMVNVGEAVFFSFGGVGMFIWLIIGYCRQCAQSRPGNTKFVGRMVAIND